ncbi:FkbM family methyltransferase [Gammaproteobacteria bacterium]|nr:FkbM family methyltransferase [Gammaproteobacteria bacterium]
MNIDIEWPDMALKKGLEIANEVSNSDLYVFDIGAHHGETFSTFYNCLGGNFKYSGFEPDPETYKTLLNNVKGFDTEARDISAEYFNEAVGPSLAQMDFYRTSASAVSGLLKPEGELDNRVPAGDHNIQDIIKVNVNTIDNVIEANGHVNFLKIDTEGFDLECLKGASRSLLDNKIDVVMCETFFVKYRVGQAYFWDIAKYLEEHGYYFVNIYDARDTGQGRLYTANGIWVSNTVAKSLDYL